MLTALIALTVIILSVVLYWYIAQPPLHRGINPEQLYQYIWALYKRGSHGAYMIIRPKGKKEFVQFLKDISESGEISIYSHYCSGSWAEQYYEDIETILKNLNVKYAWPTNNSERCMEINFHTDISTCQEFVRQVNRNILGIPDDQMQFNIWFRGVNAEDKLIDKR